MKIINLVQAAACSALLVAGAAQAATNLIINGDFELSSALVGGGGYTTVFAGSNAITGWTVGGNSVDLIKGAYGAINGTSVDMLGTPGPGALSQSFNAVAGGSYLLTFDLSRNPNASGATAIDVLFGNVNQSFTSSVNGVVDHFSLLYTAASSGPAALSFSSFGGDGYSGAVLDNVSVTAAVPEPETYAMLLAGLGLVGFLKRRRTA